MLIPPGIGWELLLENAPYFATLRGGEWYACMACGHDLSPSVPLTRCRDCRMTMLTMRIEWDRCNCRPR